MIRIRNFFPPSRFLPCSLEIKPMRVQWPFYFQVKKLRNLLLFVLFVGVCLPIPATAKKIENLSILVPSCDKYSEVWNPFFTLLFKYWPNLEQNIYLISNDKIYEDKRVIIIAIGKEKSWSDNVLIALDKIPDTYVMIIMDDYLITSTVLDEKINELFAIMKAENAGYLQLKEASGEQSVIPHPAHQELAYFSKNSDYRNSLQAAIWNKDVLKQILQAGENPWEFELKGAARSSKIKRPFMSLLSNSPISYFGAIEKGYWAPQAIEILEKENISVKTTMPISSKLRLFLRGDVRYFLSKNFVQPMRRMIKQYQDKE